MENIEIMEALMARDQQEASQSRKVWGIAIIVAAGALGCLKAADVGNIEKGSDGVLRIVQGAETFNPED